LTDFNNVNSNYKDGNPLTIRCKGRLACSW